jgi:predicted ATP-grasp superfamily ATP-dependent carboligase
MSLIDEVSPRVLIAGVSARALAASAARAGYQVTAVDAFGDLDLERVAKVIAIRSEAGARYRPMTAATAAARLTADSVAYTSNFENFPAAVDRLARDRELLGNTPAVLRRVRDPLGLMRALQRHGFAVPHTSTRVPDGARSPTSWLLKPRRSGGGHGTSRWRGQAVPRSHYVQERIAGVPGSVVFAADGRRAVPLGLSVQLVGDPKLGGTGFRYGGSLMGHPAALFSESETLVENAVRMAAAVTVEFGLIGLNGIDFIARDGVPYPIEVNPRYSASMELFERIHGVSIFETHRQACHGTLPARPRDPGQVEGKAVVYARRNITLGDTRRWLRHGSYADVPHPGEKITRGHPICTVFAAASDPATCYTLLIRRAAAVYRSGLSRKPRAA